MLIRARSIDAHACLATLGERLTSNLLRVHMNLHDYSVLVFYLTLFYFFAMI